MATMNVSPAVLGQGNKVFEDALKVRMNVFVEEQGIAAENEVDEDEPRCWHWAAYDAESRPVGAIRLVTPPHPSHTEGPEHEPVGSYLKIGRLATLKECRGKGVAKLLVETAVEFAKANPKEVGCRAVDGTRIDGEWDGRILIHAQVNVKHVWARLGFVEDPEMGEWVEEGIMHCGMWRIGS
ncbi:acyl-CoA N-acyltransferase [Geopyxis carbonaria]|nr:acyl-CoA N-acyltransferase [Geopyxis carbonaria]